MAKRKNPKLLKLWSLMALCFSLLLIYLGYLDLTLFSQPTNRVLAAKTDSSGEVLFWENLLQVSPSYIDALIRLSYLETQRGNLNRARQYWFSAFQANPNSKSVLEAKKALGFWRSFLAGGLCVRCGFYLGGSLFLYDCFCSFPFGCFFGHGWNFLFYLLRRFNFGNYFF